MKKTKLFVAALISMFAFTCGVKAVEVKTAEELKSREINHMLHFL